MRKRIARAGRPWSRISISFWVFLVLFLIVLGFLVFYLSSKTLPKLEPGPTPISFCSVIIDSPGEYVLTKNIFYWHTYGACVYIGSDNVTLDGRGFSIYDGSPKARGITISPFVGAPSLHNVTIKNLTIRDYGIGIEVISANNTFISDVNFSSLSFMGGIFFQYSSNNLVSNINSKDSSSTIFFYSSINNTLVNVTFTGNGLAVPSCGYTYSDWSECNSSGFQTRTILTFDGLSGYQTKDPYGFSGCLSQPSLTRQCTCTNFTFGPWGACNTGSFTRLILHSYPEGCTGGYPSTILYGAFNPYCALPNYDYTYSNWSECNSSGRQTRTMLNSSAFPEILGSPILERQCIYHGNDCINFTYSDWSACDYSGQQTRTVVSSSPEGCTGGNPVLTQVQNPCTYSGIFPPSLPSVPDCINFTYSDWSACSNGMKTRTVLSTYPTSPMGCIGTIPDNLTMDCPCTEVNYSDWFTYYENTSTGCQQQGRWMTYSFPTGCARGVEEDIYRNIGNCSLDCTPSYSWSECNAGQQSLIVNFWPNYGCYYGYSDLMIPPHSLVQNCTIGVVNPGNGGGSGGGGGGGGGGGSGGNVNNPVRYNQSNTSVSNNYTSNLSSYGNSNYSNYSNDRANNLDSSGKIGIYLAIVGIVLVLIIILVVLFLRRKREFVQ